MNLLVPILDKTLKIRVDVLDDGIPPPHEPYTTASFCVGAHDPGLTFHVRFFRGTGDELFALLSRLHRNADGEGRRFLDFCREKGCVDIRPQEDA